MLRWIKCKRLDLTIFHLFKHCSLCWWLGPGFRLISPESNISKWKKIQISIFKFRNRIKSAVHSSNQKLKIIRYLWTQTQKKSDLVQVATLLKKSVEFLFLRHKRVIHTKKRKIIFTFLSLFCLHQSRMNKITGNIIHNSSEVILLCNQIVWVISLPTLTLELEDKM